MLGGQDAALDFGIDADQRFWYYESNDAGQYGWLEARTGAPITAPEWRSAVAAVPRHHLVPRYWTQDSTGTWQETDTATDPAPVWLDRIYSNAVLISALRGDPPDVRMRSSSSQPGLMVRMLEALRITAGHRVLEIGTGTGYNAALLCHRLGSQSVYTIDVEPDLVDLARRRLAELGHTPTVRTGDGVLGMPEHAPLDRIIATCAVPAIPWTWIEQLVIGGQVLTDLKIAQNAGSLVKLHRTGAERAEGRFDPVYAAFMNLHPATPPSWPERVTEGARTGRRSTTVDPRTPWMSLVVWFIAAFDIGADVSIGYVGTDPARPPSTVRISTRDGSWAEITIAAEHDGIVTEGGPRALWRMVEDAQQLWEGVDRPDWSRFGMTVTPDRQTVWLDNPDNGLCWDLAAAEHTAR